METNEKGFKKISSPTHRQIMTRFWKEDNPSGKWEKVSMFDYGDADKYFIFGKKRFAKWFENRPSAIIPPIPPYWGDLTCQ